MDIIKIGKSIAKARKNAGFTQEEMAEKLGVTPQAVSKWENGHNLPDLENLISISEITNTPYSYILSSGSKAEEGKDFVIRDRLFHEENMFTRMRTLALTRGMNETYRALEFMRKRHTGQFRNLGKFAHERALYINHPLVMACQAEAFGIHDDALIASILLHDVVEDTGTGLSELPFCDEVREIVGLLSFSVPSGMDKETAKKAYYKKIAGNGKACVVKIIDRCNNVSTMAASFSPERMKKYIRETETYILPLMNVLKNNYPEYSGIAFLIKYQILSVLETVKCMMVE